MTPFHSDWRWHCLWLPSLALFPKLVRVWFSKSQTERGNQCYTLQVSETSGLSARFAWETTGGLDFDVEKQPLIHFQRINTAINTVAPATNIVPLATKTSVQQQKCDYTFLKHLLQTGNATKHLSQLRALLMCKSFPLIGVQGFWFEF